MHDVKTRVVLQIRFRMVIDVQFQIVRQSLRSSFTAISEGLDGSQVSFGASCFSASGFTCRAIAASI